MARTYKVDIQNMKFDPASSAVATGDTVEWTNRMGMAHTVTADDGSFDSGAIGTNQTFSQVFTAAGTFFYHCEIHPHMKGEVAIT